MPLNTACSITETHFMERQIEVKNNLTRIPKGKSEVGDGLLSTTYKTTLFNFTFLCSSKKSIDKQARWEKEARAMTTILLVAKEGDPTITRNIQNHSLELTWSKVANCIERWAKWQQPEFPRLHDSKQLLISFTNVLIMLLCVCLCLPLPLCVYVPLNCFWLMVALWINDFQKTPSVTALFRFYQTKSCDKTGIEKNLLVIWEKAFI